MAADPQRLPQKVKFLCSFGGQILPRPSDGLLRYAGGETRILTFRRDVSLAEISAKLADVLGQPAALRYQLPDVDLDALVSVSTPDDLDNMMEEYDKLARADPSAKLRVFLFTPSDAAAASDPTPRRPSDTGQLYFDAVNGMDSLRRKDSLNSAGSSVGNDSPAAADGIEGTSPAIPSPVVDNPDQSTLLFAVPPLNAPAQLVNLNAAHPDQSGLLTQNPPRPELPLYAPYPPHVYADQSQVQYASPHVGSVSPCAHALPATAVSQAGGVVEEIMHLGRAAQVQSDASYRAAYQTLSQLPPMSPMYLQPHNPEWYGLHAGVPQRPQGHVLRMVDCYMCQKGLLHAHSDSVLQESGSGGGSGSPEAGVGVLQSAQSEDAARLRAPIQAVNRALADYMVDSKPENMMAAGQFGSYVFPRFPETQHESGRTVVSNTESTGRVVSQPSATMGLPSDSHGLYVNVPHSQYEDSLRQQHQLAEPTQKQQSGASQVSHGMYVNVPQSQYEDSLRQQQQLTEPTQKQQSSASQVSHGLNVNVPQSQYEDSLRHQQQLSESTKKQQSTASQASHGLYVNVPHSQYEDFLRHQQQLSEPIQKQQLPSFVGQPRLMVRPDLITTPYNNVVYPVRNLNGQPAEYLSQGSVLDSTYDYARSMSGMLESLRVTPCENSGYNDNWRPIVTTSNNGALKEFKPENLPLVQNSHPIRQQVVGEPMFASNAFAHPGIVPEGMYIRPADQLLHSSAGFTQLQNIQPADQLLPSSAGFTQLQNIQSAVPSQVLLFNQETGAEPMIPNGRLHVNPAYSCSTDPSHNSYAINNIPTGDRKDETFRDLKDVSSDVSGTPSVTVPVPSLSSNVTNGHVELAQQQVPSVPLFYNQEPVKVVVPSDPLFYNQEPVKVAVPSDPLFYNQEPVKVLVPSDPLFYNQEPVKVLVNTSILPPLPPKVVSKEAATAKDLLTDSFLVSNNKGPDVAAMLEEVVLHQHPNSLIKDSSLEHPVRATRVEGSGDEQIKRELQALAEGVASSVLQSSVTSAPISIARETKEPTLQSNIMEDSSSSHSAATLGDHRIEEIKTKRVDNVNHGLPVGDEIGRLQIINNSDLEELRELGSGTFGTVYHGKWRGSDVAIKRINDRCFVGKPSEQERMRADFWNEACNLADLHHPNVVAFYGVVLDGPGGSVATVTEYMANGSLRHALQKNDKTLDQRKRLLIAMDVAFGMEYLHGKNIVHFDLKSDNLLVNLRDPQRPICKVGDLGLSKVKCHTLISGGVRGTLPWMAPELLNGSSSLVSEKVDVFSFGIVMWELLTGKEPYADLHYGMIIGGIVNNTLRPTVPESCGPEWRSLMEKCWSAEPSERPSFTEVASRLRAMAASIPPKSR